MFIIAGDEYAADISEKLKEHAFMATEVGSTGDFLQYGQTV
ncbi:cyclic-di-AMP receptor, partial [[Clostridium] innocuum]|nr:cyclic-di-AMP receptor [[Clostridium] innocuum]